MTTSTPTSSPVPAAAASEGPGEPTRRPGAWWATSRAAGVLYLTIFVSGLFSEVVVRAGIIDVDDPSATAADLLANASLWRLGLAADGVMLLADVAIAVVLFLLLRPISPVLALMAGAFRLAQSTVLGLNLLSMSEGLRVLEDPASVSRLGIDQIEATSLLHLESHRYGYVLGLVFFGVATMIIGRLVAGDRRMPTALGVVLFLAGAGYVADAVLNFGIANYDGGLSPIVLAPAVIGELWFALWLLLRGGRVLDAPAREALDA